MATPKQSAGPVLRWIAFVPGAIFGSGIVNYLLTTPALGIVQTIGIFASSASIVAIGTWVAPNRKNRVAWILFWVTIVLYILIELFRTPLASEPLPHLVRVALATAGALCGLILMLRLIRIKPSDKTDAALSVGPQNPWAGEGQP